MKFLKQVADSTGATVHGSDRKVGSPERRFMGAGQARSTRPPFSDDALGRFEGFCPTEFSWGRRYVKSASYLNVGLLGLLTAPEMRARLRSPTQDNVQFVSLQPILVLRRGTSVATSPRRLGWSLTLPITRRGKSYWRLLTLATNGTC